jgi:AcrR family transcriptional regulator
MGRWEPDAMGRLRTAALDLFTERGFDGTTVAEIADRAGLTARTFFRYFTDKREVLFAGSDSLQSEMVDALRAAPQDTKPLAAVGAALDAAADLIGGDREFSARRQAIIAGTDELRERELSKLASLAGAMVQGLRDRGVDDGVARLAAEAGIAVFRVAFERWVDEPDDRPLGQVMRESLDQLRSLSVGCPDR